MKLKKIASLALAGIMAVSMLAGCNGSTSQEDPSSSSQVPATSNAVEYANNMLSAAQKKIFEFGDDINLNKALQNATKDYSNVKSADIGGAYDKLNGVYTNGSAASNVLKAITNDLNPNDFISIPSNEFASVNVTGTHKYGAVYLVTGKISEEGAVSTAVNAFDSGNSEIKDMLYPLSKTGLKMEYDAAISTVKMTNPENANQSAWVVAIVVTQTATKVEK